MRNSKGMTPVYLDFADSSCLCGRSNKQIHACLLEAKFLLDYITAKNISSGAGAGI